MSGLFDVVSDLVPRCATVRCRSFPSRSAIPASALSPLKAGRASRPARKPRLAPMRQALQQIGLRLSGPFRTLEARRTVAARRKSRQANVCRKSMILFKIRCRAAQLSGQNGRSAFKELDVQMDRRKNGKSPHGPCRKSCMPHGGCLCGNNRSMRESKTKIFVVGCDESILTRFLS